MIENGLFDWGSCVPSDFPENSLTILAEAAELRRRGNVEAATAILEHLSATGQPRDPAFGIASQLGETGPSAGRRRY